MELDAETKSPTTKFTNGVLKRLHPVVVTYKECLKNHAATLGAHALDGCGEFMPSPALVCAACGCHRNFHRRDPEDPPNALPALEYLPHHRHHPPPPPPPHSPSPPPISSSYYPSAPHMLLALSHGHGPPPDSNTPMSSAAVNAAATPMLNSSSRKRYRTKFTQFQKDKMLEFAEKVEWKMQKRNEDAINEFCGKFGLDRGVFKVWMHNNKNAFAKKDQPPPPHLSNNTTEISAPPPVPTTNGNGNHLDGDRDIKKDDVHGEELGLLHLRAHALGINGSSS